MKKPLAEIIPLILAKGAAPAAVASSLLAPVAMGASGDLDPTFGDVGRVTELLDFRGTAWSVQALEDGNSIVAGGHTFFSGFYYSNDFADEGFEGRLTPSGSTDSRHAFRLLDIQIRDVALQSDGKAVAVGRTLRGRSRSSSRATVLRLATDGTLDSTFGTDGLVHFPEGEGAHSVTIDADGRIVVAGTNDDGQLMVLRLLDTGALDTTFGTAGIFLGPSTDNTYDDGTPNRILPVVGGGYRVSTSRCNVVALTAQGTLITSFGDSGVATLDPPTGSFVVCKSMAAQPNGRLLLGGRTVPENGDPMHGLTVRLLTNGNPDTSFKPTTIADTMEDVTAMTVDGTSILVAGRAIESVPAALVMRLQADGTLDGLFGNSGSSWIDLPSDSGLHPIIQDMNVLPDGRILVAGGDDSSELGARPFLARLLGNTGGGPGVLGIAQPHISVDEQSHEAVIPVKRMAGSSGEVSVRYQITTTLDSDLPPATAGEDFTSASGRVTWLDGETQDQEIRVPIFSNDAAAESPERFIVTLDDLQGQAGLGTRGANVDINGTQEPAGRLGFATTEVSVTEFELGAEIWINRDFYGTGPVTVTVTPVAGGTATAGDDYVASPVTVSWADGDFASKSVKIALRNDTVRESTETITLQLSDPTGGAFIGPSSTMRVIVRDDDVGPSSGGGGGGGAFGFLSVLLLGAVRFLRTLFRPGHRTRAPP